MTVVTRFKDRWGVHGAGTARRDARDVGRPRSGHDNNHSLHQVIPGCNLSQEFQSSIVLHVRCSYQLGFQVNMWVLFRGAVDIWFYLVCMQRQRFYDDNHDKKLLISRKGEIDTQ